MKYIVTFILIILLFPTLLFAQPETVRIVTGEESAAFLPILERIMNEAGIDFIFESLPPERAHHEFNNENYDMYAFAFPNKLLLLHDTIKVPEFMAKEPIMAYVMIGNEFPVKGWNSLQPYSIGIIRGQKITEINTKNFPDVQKVVNSVSLFKMLESGRIDVAILMHSLAEPVLNKLNLKDRVTALTPPIMLDSVYILIKKHFSHLIPPLNRIIKKLRESGEIQKMMAEISNNKMEDF